MKTFILLLIFVTLLQTAFIPVNLCLILLVCRSLVISDRMNFYLALISGIVLGLLSSSNLGFYPLIFLVYIYLLSLFKKSAFSTNFLLFLPIALLIYATTAFLEKLIFNQSFSFSKLIFETLLTLPLYLLVRFWEERFVVRKGIKLKI